MRASRHGEDRLVVYVPAFLLMFFVAVFVLAPIGIFVYLSDKQVQPVVAETTCPPPKATP